MTRDEFIASKLAEYKADPRNPVATADVLVTVERQAGRLYDRLAEARGALSAAEQPPVTAGQLHDRYGWGLSAKPTVQTHAIGWGESLADKAPEFRQQLADAEAQERAWAEGNARWMEAHRLVLGGVPIAHVASTGPQDPDPHWRK